MKTAFLGLVLAKRVDFSDNTRWRFGVC